MRFNKFQVQVCECVASGWDNQDIAIELNAKVRTVEKCVNGLYKQAKLESLKSKHEKRNLLRKFCELLLLNSEIDCLY